MSSFNEIIQTALFTVIAIASGGLTLMVINMVFHPNDRSDRRHKHTTHG